MTEMVRTDEDGTQWVRVIRLESRDPLHDLGNGLTESPKEMISYDGYGRIAMDSEGRGPFVIHL